jgi:hypothetical protein
MRPIIPIVTSSTHASNASCIPARTQKPDNTSGAHARSRHAPASTSTIVNTDGLFQMRWRTATNVAATP